MLAHRIPTGRIIHVNPVPKTIALVLERLCQFVVNPGDSVKIDNAPDVYMALRVSFVAKIEQGQVYCIAHYVEQNGDLVPDPSMELLRVEDSSWYPLAFSTQYGRGECLLIVDTGRPKVDEFLYAKQIDLLRLWMRNVVEQQGLG